MVKEAYATSDAIRAACEASITSYCEALAPDIDAAIARHGIAHGVGALSLARHVQAVLQGAFIMAKTANDPAIARDSVTHLTSYILMLFGRGGEEERRERIFPMTNPTKPPDNPRMIFVNLTAAHPHKTNAY